MNNDVNKNPDGSYMDRDEIFDDIVKNNRLDAETIQYIKADFQLLTLSDEDMFRSTYFHAGNYTKIELGRWIRNSYGLWNEDNPHINLSEGPYSYFHPDNYCAAIITDLILHYAKK